MDLKFIYSELSHRGNVRSQNEDSFISKKTVNGHLFTVCDGMGGSVGGKKASSIAVKSIVEYFERKIYTNVNFALAEAIKFANQQIYFYAMSRPHLKGMGTTCCVLLIQGSHIYYAHVGDSRINLYSNNNLYHLTRDHSYVMQLLDKGMISEEELSTHRDKNRILKALGVHNNVDPTVSMEPLQLKKDDLILIFTDGLNDMVDDAAIANILADDKVHVDKKTHSLVELALQNGGKDNITVQSILITKSPFNKSIFLDNSIIQGDTIVDPAPQNITNPQLRLALFAFLGTCILVAAGLIMYQVPQIAQLFDKSPSKKTTATSVTPSKKTISVIEGKSNETVPFSTIELAFLELENSIKTGDCVDFLDLLKHDDSLTNLYFDKVDEIAWRNTKNNPMKVAALNIYISNFSKYKKEAKKELAKIQKGNIKKGDSNKDKIVPTLSVPDKVTIIKGGKFPYLISIVNKFKSVDKKITIEFLKERNNIKDIDKIPDGTIIHLTEKPATQDTDVKVEKENVEEPVENITTTSNNPNLNKEKTLDNTEESQDPHQPNSTDPNTTDPNTTDSNTTDSNTTDSNTADSNTADSNTADSNTADSNTADSNTTDEGSLKSMPAKIKYRNLCELITISESMFDCILAKDSNLKHLKDLENTTEDIDKLKNKSIKYSAINEEDRKKIRGHLQTSNPMIKTTDCLDKKEK